MDITVDGGRTEPAVVPGVAEHLCPDCANSFATLRGLGVHRRSQHPSTFHAEQLARLQPKKARWSKQEELRLAMLEAKMWAEDPTITNMNQLLLACFGQERTLESIKGKRRSPAYRILVDAEKTKLMTVRPNRPRRNVARGHPNDGPEADEDNPVVEPGRDVDAEDDNTVIYSRAPESVDAEDQVPEGDTTI
ncbi:hypothetical protein JTE90_016094 [Oedothorax gibbosus]|uniref:C2H2-type domain-containing protein n=1 Tax=Oedothorax gibbosus TaxID=931172 RepID=A0AAV6TRQ8_9ARAC|nr:hypothetical protein JTE90_016094 [Oedothorax gibbosus]